jgi:hypothetical protein
LRLATVAAVPAVAALPAGGGETYLIPHVAGRKKKLIDGGRLAG